MFRLLLEQEAQAEQVDHLGIPLLLAHKEPLVLRHPLARILLMEVPLAYIRISRVALVVAVVVDAVVGLLEMVVMADRGMVKMERTVLGIVEARRCITLVALEMLVQSLLLIIQAV
jgi:hypothetical protein